MQVCTEPTCKSSGQKYSGDSSAGNKWCVVEGWLMLFCGWCTTSMFNSWPHQLNCSAVDAVDGALATHAKPGDVTRFLQGSWAVRGPCSLVEKRYTQYSSMLWWSELSPKQPPAPAHLEPNSITLSSPVYHRTYLTANQTSSAFKRLQFTFHLFHPRPRFLLPPSLFVLSIQLSHGRLCWKTDSRRIGTCKHGPRRGMSPQ